uniref:Uncharacterized protein LOC104216167 isoform X1 n=1 Tax=Nicotiana sylvestris TaxID=4096 RepID=A0A1U7VRF2_NICSY|nr:PREDICTED: uncharacterized protein LOC104216167 isoform X1 [Nicotiana sylvestris]
MYGTPVGSPSPTFHLCWPPQTRTMKNQAGRYHQLQMQRNKKNGKQFPFPKEDNKVQKVLKSTSMLIRSKNQMAQVSLSNYSMPTPVVNAPTKAGHPPAQVPARE